MVVRICCILFLISLTCCDQQNKKTTQKLATDTIPAIPVQVSSAKTDSAQFTADPIPSFEVDDYPVTDKMLSQEAHSRKSGEIQDGEGAWFTNNKLNQTLVFVLYTDFHRLVTYHFVNDDIPTGMIDRMELHASDGDLASLKQKQKFFRGFLSQSKEINTQLFTTNKGFKIGDNKNKAIKTYGQPDSISVSDGIERLNWDFIGDTFYDKTKDPKGKPLAKNNYGHQVTMFFRNNRLIGLILHNDIP